MKKLLSLLLLTIFSSTLLLGCSGRTLKEGKTYTVKYLKEFEDKTYGFGDLKDNYLEIVVLVDSYIPSYQTNIVGTYKSASFLKDDQKVVIDVIKHFKKGPVAFGHIEGIELIPDWAKRINEQAEYYD